MGDFSTCCPSHAFQDGFENLAAGVRDHCRHRQSKIEEIHKTGHRAKKIIINFMD